MRDVAAFDLESKRATELYRRVVRPLRVAACELCRHYDDARCELLRQPGRPDKRCGGCKDRYRNLLDNGLGHPSPLCPWNSITVKGADDGN